MKSPMPQMPQIVEATEKEALAQAKCAPLPEAECLDLDWSSRCLGKGEIYGFRESSRRTYIASPCASHPEVQLTEFGRAWKHKSEGIANARK
jgi:hypothetical protein